MSVTLAQLLSSSRVFALREAIVARLAEHFTDVAVRAHLGRLDMSDVQAGDVFPAPSLNVAITRLPAYEGRLSGHRDAIVEVAVYVVTKDQAIVGAPTALRDEIALALCDGVLDVVADPAAARWGLDDIAPPEAAEARPLFTAAAEGSGTAYYVVTWRQTLITLGSPYGDLDSAAGDDVLALLPGDAGWTPPLAGGVP